MCTVGVWGSCTLDEMSDGEAIKALFRQRNAIDSEIQRRLHRFDKSEGYAADGSLTAKAWLRWNCNLTHGQASDRVEVAREMQSMPQTTEALTEGEISYQHASLIARTKQGLGELWPDDAEEILVTAARQVNPVDLRRATVQLRHCLEPDGDIPAIWSDAHHIEHWANGGLTRLFNLVLLCRRHHRMVHEGRWHLQAAGDGVLQAVPP